MKIIVADFHRTITEKQKFQIKDKNYQAIINWRNQGNLFIINTGQCLAILKNDGLLDKNLFDYLIASNGSCIFDNELNLLDQITISKKDQKIVC